MPQETCVDEILLFWCKFSVSFPFKFTFKFACGGRPALVNFGLINRVYACACPAIPPPTPATCGGRVYSLPLCKSCLIHSSTTMMNVCGKWVTSVDCKETFVWIYLLVSFVSVASSLHKQKCACDSEGTCTRGIVANERLCRYVIY